MLIKNLKLKDLRYSEYNPRKTTKEQEKHLRDSLTKFGVVEPIVVNSYPSRENIIIGGHFRVRELKKLSYESVDCVIVNLNEEDEKELNIRLNSNTGDWDLDMLNDNFDSNDLKNWGLDLDNFDNLGKNYDIVEDKVDNIVIDYDEEPTTKIGDIVQLGRHRLMCGDSTNANDIQLLLNGAKANMVFTDPPYNINFYSSTDRNKRILNDNIAKEDFDRLIASSFKNLRKSLAHENCHVYICCNYKCYSVFEKHFKDNFSNLNTCIVWNKDTIGLGQAYRNKHEFIIFGGNFKNCSFKDKTQSNVWEFPSASSFSFRKTDNEGNNDNLMHPTMKPIALVSKAILNSSREDDIILDTFGGSGSTLIACEETNRICYMMELDPKYCDVIMQRYKNFKC